MTSGKAAAASPVTLGLVYIEVGRRGGLQVQGVDFPGHFLLRIDTAEGPLALDPFSEGRVVLPIGTDAAGAAWAGLLPHAAERPEALMATPVPNRAVLIRLQNNIFARASQAQDYARAERSALRRALLDPSDHRPWLDARRRPRGPGRPRRYKLQSARPRPDPATAGRPSSARAARERVRLQLN